MMVVVLVLQQHRLLLILLMLPQQLPLALLQLQHTTLAGVHRDASDLMVMIHPQHHSQGLLWCSMQVETGSSHTSRTWARCRLRRGLPGAATAMMVAAVS